MSLSCTVGGVDVDLSEQQLSDLLSENLAKLGQRHRVLAVPPDITRYHSHAGQLTQAAWIHYGDRLKAVLPAIGTHAPMPAGPRLRTCLATCRRNCFAFTNWRTDVETLGEVPAEFIHAQSGRRS